MTDRQSMFEKRAAVGHDVEMATGPGRRKAATRGAAAKKDASAPKVRKERAELRHEALLSAAARIFIEHGIVATSIDQIVEAAGVAKGTFYLHFDSKEQLLAALQRRFIDRFRADLQAATDRRRPDDYRGRLRAWIATGVDVYIDRAAEHDLVFHQFRQEGPHEPHDNAIVAQLTELLAAGARARAWLTATPRMTAVMLFAALHGALDEAVHPPTRSSLASLSAAAKAARTTAAQTSVAQTARSASQATTRSTRKSSSHAKSRATSGAAKARARVDRDQLVRTLQTFFHRALGLG